VDFGLAAIEQGLSNDAWVQMPNARTIDYAALERATGVHKDDTRSDIYFLGCIYYHMLTGKAPLAETRDRARRLSRQRLEEVVPVQQTDPSIPNSVAIVVHKAMDLDPDHRYQTPKQMLRDLEAAAQKLRDGTADDADLKPKAEPAFVVETQEDKPRHSVMVVESNPRLQDAFRDGLRKAGYRVLLTSDPQRAVERLLDDARTAACVVFDAKTTGQVALEAFNQLGDEARTQHVPAILLLDKPQHRWRDQAKTATHRVLMSMPVSLKKLRTALAQLVPTETGS
jgi:serine/threonine-protein kinase